MLTTQNNRDFTAPYEFREFPKSVKLADGSKVIVHNADEEAILTAPADDADPERAELLAKAKEMGLGVHPRIGTDKLREKLAAAAQG